MVGLRGGGPPFARRVQDCLACALSSVSVSVADLAPRPTRGPAIPTGNTRLLNVTCELLATMKVHNGKLGLVFYCKIICCGRLFMEFNFSLVYMWSRKCRADASEAIFPKPFRWQGLLETAPLQKPWFKGGLERLSNSASILSLSAKLEVLPPSA